VFEFTRPSIVGFLFGTV